MPDGKDPRTTTLRWETAQCPKCKERTTFWLLSDRVSRCCQCDLEIDRSRGLGLDSSIFQTR
ncbi:MAG: hypothetical protein L6R43_00885 [Planctomycetes bacterium]|nr:hypothetical protein [Planctomycetota bacterium]